MYDTSKYPDPHNNDAENNLFGLDGIDAKSGYLIMGILILCLFAAIMTVIIFYKRQKDREKDQKNQLKRYDTLQAVRQEIHKCQNASMNDENPTDPCNGLYDFVGYLNTIDDMN